MTPPPSPPLPPTDPESLHSGHVRSAAPELLAAFATYLVAAGRSPGTVQLRLYYLERLARVTGGELLTVTAADLMSFLAHPSWSPETRKSARTSLAAFYGWTCAAGYLEHNPAAWLPPVPVPAGVPRPTPDRVLRHALAAAANDRDRLMVLLAAYAGLRRAEIARVRPGDFTREGLRVVGKGGRGRLVPVHPELAAAVRDELERRAAGGRGTGWRYWSGISLFGPLFPNSAGASRSQPMWSAGCSRGCSAPVGRVTRCGTGSPRTPTPPSVT